MTISDVNRVLRTAFPNRDGEVWVEWGHFDPHLVIEQRGRIGTAMPDDRAVYYCAGIIRPGGTRCNADIEAVHVLTVDDVGTKIDLTAMEMLAPPPTFVIETSPGNCQWQYVIDGGMDPDTYVALRASMKAHPVWGHSEAIAPSNLIRLPMGVNGKPGIAHHVVMTVKGSATPSRELIEAFGGLTVSVAQLKASVLDLRAPSDGALAAALARLPNDGTSPYCADYLSWITFGLALYGATGGEGCDLWEDWSSQQPQAVDPSEKWTSFGGTKIGWDYLASCEDKWGSGAREPLARALFDDGEELPVTDEDSGDSEEIILDGEEPADTRTLPRRPWLYGKRLLRGYLSSTIAAGGTGKSSLTMVEAIAMATGRDLLTAGAMPRAPLRVLIWNGEDPRSELVLRFNAVCRQYGLTGADFNRRLFMVSGRDRPLRLGHEKFTKPDLAWLRGVIRGNRIDVVIIDPFVSSHRVPENDNMAIDAVAKAWSNLAEEMGCAVDLVHHIRKPAGNGAIDLSVDDARGASALVNASRNARVLSPMGDKVAKECGIVNRRAYFAIQHDATKANMVPSMTGASWFKFASVDMGNGDPFPVDGLGPIEADSVGVVEPWVPSAPMSSLPANVIAAQGEIAKGDWKMHPQSKDWVGDPIARALGLDVRGDRKMIEGIVDQWVREGWLKVIEKLDSHREMKKFAEVGKAPEGEEF